MTGIPCFFELARVGDGGFDVGEKILLVALGCGRLPGILEITARHPFVVFGTAKEPAPSFSYVVQLGLSSKEIGELFRKGVAEEGKGAENIEIKFLENDPEKISKEMESNGRLYRPWVKALMEHYAFSLKEG